MLFEDMNISRLMTHAQQVEGENLLNMTRRIRSLEHATMTIHNKNMVVVIDHSFSRNIQLQVLK